MNNEKAININMFDADNALEEYYDAQECKEVEHLQWYWSYIYKYEYQYQVSYSEVTGENKEDDVEEDEMDEGNYDEQEEERKNELFWEYLQNLLYEFRETIIKYRKDAISQRAINEYKEMLNEVNELLCEEDWEDDYVPDEKHLEELKEARRIAALNQQLEDLETERQRYLEAIQESEALISKLKEKNVDPSIIADEKALIEKNKSCIEELNQQISALRDTLSTNK